MKKIVGVFLTSYCSEMIANVTPGCIPDDWVQLTELVEIDFITINKDEVIKKQIAIIDDQITEENGKHYAEIKRLEQRKAELLAITYEIEAVQDHEPLTTEEMKVEYDYK